MFRDRKDAGQNLARALSKYKDKGVLVLGIARGGVEIAYEVARYLNAEMSILVTRKLPLPFNPEAGFGAIAEDGSEFIREDTYDWLSESEVERIIKEQKAEIIRRIEVLRGGKPLPKIEERTVILVDDGLAMGSTMRASIDMCKKNNAGKIIVAVPVSGSETAQEIEKIADELIILEMPPYFRAVAQIYLNWHDVSDQEVQNFMRKWKRLRAKETEK
jgi:putative phosphoribosyl transferase